MLIYVRAASLDLLNYVFFVGTAMVCKAGAIQEINKYAISMCDDCSGLDWL